MPIQPNIPGFGSRRMTDDYYAAINSIIKVLRPHSTLRVISAHLSAQGFKTASGLDWTRERVASYLKTNHIN